MFQPTLPHGERLDSQKIDDDYLRCFNPRSRTGSDSTQTVSFAKFPTFQPTLPHGERLVKVATTDRTVKVSTRAPARGATFLDPLTSLR